MTNVKSRIGTTTNLPQGATNDLLVISFPGGFPESQLKFNIDDTPRKITGIQKVAQLFLKILFTSVGSNVIYPSQGTNFQLLTINANITTNDTIFISELNSEIKSAEGQVKAILNTNGSDTASQLDSITVLGLDVGNEAVVLYLRILTKAGAQAQISVPFPQLDLNLNGDR
jgi:hypothetical protein